MKNTLRTSFGPGRIRMAITFAPLALLLVAHHPIVGAQQADATNAPPLIVFAESEARADQAPLSADAAVTLEAIQSDPAVSGIRIGRSSPAAIAVAHDARVLSVIVPSAHEASADAAEAIIAFTGVDVEHNDEGMTSLYAQDDATDSEVALVIQGADLLGSIRRGDETYKVHPLGDGLTAVYHYDTSQLRRHPPNWGEFMRKNERMQRQAPTAPPRDDAGASGAAADTGDVIDVLVAYTPAARRAAGNIDTFIQFAIDNTHRIYRNSNIGLRLRLVHKYATSYTEHPSDMGVDLDRLTVTSDTIIDGERWDPDGHMDEVHGLRDRYGADLVALIVARPTDDVCGIAWAPDFGKYPDTNLGPSGFSVTAWNCETSTSHTFAHELGHNQGARHDPDNSCDDPPCTLSTPPSFPYRYGRCNTAEDWSTTMSYQSNLQGSCRREIEYFSSPILDYRGTPTGDAARRDNRRVLIQTARRVANYRQTVESPGGGTHTLALVTPASNQTQRSLVRIINRSNRAGRVTIHAIDDAGNRRGPAHLQFAARQTRHFDSRQLEGGAGMVGGRGVGDGQGNWRLELSTTLDIIPLAYVRGDRGFVTTMHDVVPSVSGRHHVVNFNKAPVNPGTGWSQARLRLINPNSGSASVTIAGVDDLGRPAAGGTVRLTLGARAVRMVTSTELENGGSGLTGRLGTGGTGRWQLTVSASPPIRVMGLMSSPTAGYITNLSSRPLPSSAARALPFVTPASNRTQRSLVRIINRSNRAGRVTIHAIDDAGNRRGPAHLQFAARQTRHFDSRQLEGGAGMVGGWGVGDGQGNWRLELSTTLDIIPLAYVRGDRGFVTTMHDVVPSVSGRHHVVNFNKAPVNPGTGWSQARLRLINPNSGSASVTIAGVDDLGRPAAGGTVRLTLGARAARMVTSTELENGGSGLTGRLGTGGTGRWQLTVSASPPIRVMGLMSSPTAGYITNLSSRPLPSSVPPATSPDLVVQSPAVSDSSLNPGQSFTLRATVRNSGGARSAATTLRYYRSSDMTISMSDVEVGTDAVRGLSASDTSAESIVLTAPSSAGTYYYGACVDTVAGELDTTNNCSAAVRVDVSGGSGSCEVTLNRLGPDETVSIRLSDARRVGVGTISDPVVVRVRMDHPADVDSYRIDLREAGRLFILSVGNLDTEAVLLDNHCAEAGVVIGDLGIADPATFGPTNFNFGAVGDLNAGTYYLVVNEWQGRVGAYSLGIFVTDSSGAVETGASHLIRGWNSLRDRLESDGIGGQN